MEETVSKPKRTAYFDIYKDKRGEWRFRLRAANHEIIAVGQAYKRKADCVHAIELIQRTTEETPVREIEEKE